MQHKLGKKQLWQALFQLINNCNGTIIAGAKHIVSTCEVKYSEYKLHKTQLGQALFQLGAQL